MQRIAGCAGAFGMPARRSAEGVGLPQSECYRVDSVLIIVGRGPAGASRCLQRLPRPTLTQMARLLARLLARLVAEQTRKALSRTSQRQRS